MNRILMLIVAIGFCFAENAAAQARYLLNYQGELRSPGGDPLFPNTAQNITFRLYSAPTGGSSLYSETVNNVPIDAHGRFNTSIGGNASFVNQFDGGDRYLQITVAGSDILPRQLVTGSPYAFTAQNLIGNISESQLPQNAIDSSEIQDESITSADIDNGQVKKDDIASNSIDSGRIIDGEVKTADIANGTIIGSDINANTSITIANLFIKADSKVRIIEANGKGFLETTGGNGSVNCRLTSHTDSRFGQVECYNDAGTKLCELSAASGGDLWVNDKVTCQILDEQSDRRLKTDFENLGNAIERVRGINAYSYAYKNPPEDRKGTREVGFVAQEVQEVLPEAVSTDRNGYLTVRPSALVGLLIGAVQEQQKEIERLRNRLDQIESGSGKGEVPETETTTASISE